ncbi:alpha-1,2-fucosyltransferase [Bacteroidia bacterium]|nr:alpha-1,2-fucosyltransferase [Bacteroidia bacterium]
MFQYAFGQALGQDTLYDVLWFERAKLGKTTDRPFCLDVFNIPDTAFIKFRKPFFLLKLFGKYCKERDNNIFHADFLKPRHGINYFSGYFQNECYLNPVKDRLFEHFTLKNPVNKENFELLNQIRNCNSVSIHIRRGDYVQLASHLCTIEYYNAAMKLMESRVRAPLHYFLFSDDIEWCRNNIKTDMPLTIVNINSAENGYLDMELMKNCKHSIIANSSFSWMAAYLNRNPDKIVIYPKVWLMDNGKPTGNIGISKEWINA